LATRGFGKPDLPANRRSARIHSDGAPEGGVQGRNSLHLSPLHYSRGEVLNQRIENGLRFHRRGDMFEGIILAYGLRPIPGEYLDGALVPFQITFEDQFGEESIAAARLSLARPAKHRPAIPRGTGLYGMSSASKAKVSVVSEDTRRHPRPPVPSTHDDAYSGELLQPTAHRPRTSLEI
jgi:hypothetical protein